MNPSFLAVEAVSVTMFLLVAREAWTRGAASVSLLASAAAFGLAVEIFFVTQYAGYSYGPFLTSIYGVPVWVALGWGTIIWTSLAASDRMGAPWYLRPLTDGLLAVSLDVTLDPVAEALGWWHWTRPGQFFGIPYDNFIGWIAIVSFYGLSVRAMSRLGAFGPPLAVVPAALAVAGAQVGLEKVYPIAGEPLTFFAVASLLLGLSWWARRGPELEPAAAPRPWFVTGVPVAFHGLNLALLVFAGVGVAQPALYLVFLAASLASLFAFRWSP